MSPTAPDPEKLREALPKLSPEKRAALEEMVSRSYAEADREIVTWVSKNGIRFPIFSHVLCLPVPPGDTGPRVIRVVLPDDSPDDDEDL